MLLETQISDQSTFSTGSETDNALSTEQLTNLNFYKCTRLAISDILTEELETPDSIKKSLNYKNKDLFCFVNLQNREC